MNTPSLARAVPDLRVSLRTAIATIIKLTARVSKLEADIAERDHHIATLQGMLERAVDQ